MKNIKSIKLNPRRSAQLGFKDKQSKCFHYYLLLAFFSVLSPLSAQQYIDGWVLDGKTKETVPGVHVINKSTLKGTTTDGDGYFSLKLERGDTIIFSNIAYKYFYFIYSDSTVVLNEVVIKMEEQNYLLDEVSVFSYTLTTNKPKEMPLRKPSIPSNDQIRDPELIAAGINNPAEFLYNLFGSKPKQLRKLAELKAEDAYRDKLEESNNRTAVVRLTGLSQKELEAFMFYCKFALVNMNILNDYEFLLSVQACYRQYVKERELDDFLDQFD